MKKYKVTASSITYYEVEIEAENEDQAYEIGHLTDGAMFKEVPNSSDWCIYKTEELQHKPNCPAIDGFGCRCEEVTA